MYVHGWETLTGADDDHKETLMAVSKRLRYEVMRRDNHTCRYCGASAPDVPLTVDHVVPSSLGGLDEPSNLVTACTDCNSGKSSTVPGDTLVADVSNDAVRWSRAMAVAAEIQRRERHALDDTKAELARTWLRAFDVPAYIVVHAPDGRWHWESDPDRVFEWLVREYPVTDPDLPSRVVHLADSEKEAEEWAQQERQHQVPPRPGDWDASLATWLAAGITADDLEEAARIATRASHVPWETRYRYFCGVVWRMVEDRQRIAHDILTEEDADAQ